MKLINDAHERFCEEYLVDLNATAAYQRTYPAAKPAAARAAAARLFADVNISDRVAELLEARAARVQVKLDDVLRELILLAFSDVRNFTVNDLGHLELLEGAPEAAWRAVSSVKHRITSHGDDFTVREVEYRLWNKNDALKQLREHLAALAGQSGDDEDVIPLAAIRKAIARANLRAG